MIRTAAGILTDKRFPAEYYIIITFTNILLQNSAMVYHIFMTVSRRSIVKTARGNSIYERTE